MLSYPKGRVYSHEKPFDIYLEISEFIDVCRSSVCITRFITTSIYNRDSQCHAQLNEQQRLNAFMTQYKLPSDSVAILFYSRLHAL